MAPYEIVVVYFAEEAYPLAVFAESIGQFQRHGGFAHSAFGHVADREYQVFKLRVCYACKEVGLVFHRVGSGCEIHKPVLFYCVGVVPGGGAVKLVSPPLFKESEFNHPVAHYVGVRGEPCLDGVYGVLHDIVPILVVERHNVKRQFVAGSYRTAHFYVLFRVAVSAFAYIKPDSYIE